MKKRFAAQKCEGNVNTPCADLVKHAPSEDITEPDIIAIGLLKLQQRFDALERLYNEEIGDLCQELTQLKAEYVRLYQSRSTLPRKGRSTRGKQSAHRTSRAASQ